MNSRLDAHCTTSHKLPERRTDSTRVLRTALSRETSGLTAQNYSSLAGPAGFCNQFQFLTWRAKEKNLASTTLQSPHCMISQEPFFAAWVNPHINVVRFGTLCVECRCSVHWFATRDASRDSGSCWTSSRDSGSCWTSSRDSGSCWTSSRDCLTCWTLVVLASEDGHEWT